MRLYVSIILALLALNVQSQALQSPSEYLGYELGSQFSWHHQIIDYYQYVATSLSDQVELIQYGSTYEGRPLYLAVVSSAVNMASLENIRNSHLENRAGEGNASKAIVWLSYNVHGNESVSSEASMLTLYELLTSKKAYLEETVVIMDPCVNPDGRDRYVNWYKQYKNTPYQVDPNSKEHHEGWWNGRSNHYMFDLNRDWAWLTQQESRQRLKQYNKWLPHVHVDFHEQSVDAPYYFAPAAQPYHEVITDFQRTFQDSIGRNHAKYFDEQGWLYFTKEVFDLLYPSYGDTYPIYNGSIGMTYEQGGSGRAGLGVINSIGDTLTLKDRIAHHHTTGLSTVEVSARNHETLNREFRDFFDTKDYHYKGYVLQGNPDNLDALAELLEAHQIEYGAVDTQTLEGFSYSDGEESSFEIAENHIAISTAQPRQTLINVLFEPNASLVDSLTYDITAWSLPYAYGLQSVATTASLNIQPKPPAVNNISTPDTEVYGYITDWNSMSDARFLADLLSKEIRVRFARRPFVQNGISFNRGSLIILAADNTKHTNFSELVTQSAMEHKKEIYSTSTGLVEKGKDFGSRYVEMIPDVKVAVLSGEPTSTLRFGEVWHYFEQQLGYPLTVIDADYFNRIKLDQYDVLVLPAGSGYTRFLSEGRVKKIKDWISAGGRLVAMGSAIKPLEGKDGFSICRMEGKKDTTETSLKAYEDSQRDRISKSITGAIFQTSVDPTHPLAYGYDDTYFTLKLGSDTYEYLDSGNAVYLGEAPMPVAGFAGKVAQGKIGKSLVFGMENIGRGKVIYMVDNPLFRGFWENGKLFFANALFMVD